MEDFLAFCIPKNSAEKWGFACGVVSTAVLPTYDFVTDLIVTQAWLAADTAHENYWGYVSCAFMGACALVNLIWFWVGIDLGKWGPTAPPIWSTRPMLNALIGFIVTVMNLRAQGMAWIVLYHLLRKKDLNVSVLKSKGRRDSISDLGYAPNARSIAFIKLFEFLGETTPELLLQGYALLYMSYVEGVPWNKDPYLLMSIWAGFVTLVSGLSSMFLWPNSLLVKALGCLYLLGIMYARLSVFTLLFLQFGKWAILFCVAAICLRCAYFFRYTVTRREELVWQCTFDTVATLFAPVGMGHRQRSRSDDGPSQARAMAHRRSPIDVLADKVLYSQDAFLLLMLHFVENGVACYLMSTVKGRKIRASIGNSDFTIAVKSNDIFLMVVAPFCAACVCLGLIRFAVERGWNKRNKLVLMRDELAAKEIHRTKVLDGKVTTLPDGSAIPETFVEHNLDVEIALYKIAIADIEQDLQMEKQKSLGEPACCPLLINKLKMHRLTLPATRRAAKVVPAVVTTVSAKAASQSARGGRYSTESRVKQLCALPVPHVLDTLVKSYDRGFNPDVLRAAGVTARDLKQCDFVLLPSKNATSSRGVLDHAKLGFAFPALDQAGYDARQLKEGGYTADELRCAGLGAGQLKLAGFDAAQLRDAGLGAVQLKEVSFDAGQLKVAGFSAEHLKKAGFETKELQKAGFSAMQLKEAGCSATDLAPLFDLGQLVDADFHAEQLKSAGFDAAELKPHFNAEQLRAAGIGVMELLKLGFDKAQIEAARFGQQVVEAAMLKREGKSAEQLKSLGFGAREMIECDFDADQLAQADFGAAELKQVGIDAIKLAAAGFDAKQLKAAGFDALQLKQADFGAKQLESVGFSFRELVDAGFDSAQLTDAGFDAAQLKAGGFTAWELKVAGFELERLKSVNFNSVQLAEAGFNAAQLKAGGFGADELRAAGFSAEQLKAIGFSGKALKASDFGLAQLASAGFGMDELKEIGFEARLVDLAVRKYAGESARRLRAAGHTIEDLKVVGFTLEQLEEARLDPQELKDGFCGYKVGQSWGPNHGYHVHLYRTGYKPCFTTFRYTWPTYNKNKFSESLPPVFYKYHNKPAAGGAPRGTIVVERIVRTTTTRRLDRRRDRWHNHHVKSYVNIRHIVLENGNRAAPGTFVWCNPKPFTPPATCLNNKLDYDACELKMELHHVLSEEEVQKVDFQIRDGFFFSWAKYELRHCEHTVYWCFGLSAKHFIAGLLWICAFWGVTGLLFSLLLRPQLTSNSGADALWVHFGAMVICWLVIGFSLRSKVPGLSSGSDSDSEDD